MASTVSAPTSASRSARGLLGVELPRPRRGPRPSPRSRSHGTRSSSSAPTRVAGAAAAVGDVGLDRAEVAAAVEDDRQRLARARAPRPAARPRPAASRRSAPAAGGRRRARRSVHVRAGYRSSCLRDRYRLTVGIRAPAIGHAVGPGSVAAPMKLIYKPFGIILGILAGLARQEALRLRLDEDRRRGAAEADDRGDDLGQGPRRRGASRASIFKVTRVVVDRDGAEGWHYLTGVWPGEKRPRRRRRPSSAASRRAARSRARRASSSASSKAPKSRASSVVERPAGRARARAPSGAAPPRPRAPRPRPAGRAGSAARACGRARRR